ncbi:MAG: inositol-3-phosphate synthase [Planctomycetaceae bacterium]
MTTANHSRVGVWLIGAWGGVSTTVAVGLASLQRDLADETGLVSALPPFSELGLVGWDRLVIGGHEIRDTTFADAAATLNEQSGVFQPAALQAIAGRLAEFDADVRPGTLMNVGATIESLAGDRAKQTAGERPAEAIRRIVSDLNEFREGNALERVIVVNLASTEPPSELRDVPERWDDLSAALETADVSPVPASSIYAIAAMQADCAFVNFTPSVGSNLPAVCEYADRQGVTHVGRDGKTGETLLKSVLAPMFAARNLNVMSWVGHNIFGNLDGVVLDDPANKANKVHSKDHLLTEILGYRPQSLVSIEYIESMGDWKTAWDHIHFRGFLGTKMAMQFTWQGCDSLLAAPLVLDLVRFTEFEQRRGGSGVMTHLSSFFKSPMGENVPAEFARQYALLEDWAANAR